MHNLSAQISSIQLYEFYKVNITMYLVQDQDQVIEHYQQTQKPL